MGLVSANPDQPIRYGAESTIPYEDPYSIRFKPAKGWNGSWTILDDHRGFKRLAQFREWSKARHLQESIHAKHCSEVIRTAYDACWIDALDTYGNHGSLVSGIGRDHFPEATKTTLRTLIQRAEFEDARAFAHWRAAGRTRARWINERGSMRVGARQKG